MRLKSKKQNTQEKMLELIKSFFELNQKRLFTF